LKFPYTELSLNTLWPRTTNDRIAYIQSSVAQKREHELNSLYLHQKFWDLPHELVGDDHHSKVSFQRTQEILLNRSKHPGQCMSEQARQGELDSQGQVRHIKALQESFQP
jgi:hypothetical protein